MDLLIIKLLEISCLEMSDELRINISRDRYQMEKVITINFLKMCTYIYEQRNYKLESGHHNNSIVTRSTQFFSNNIIMAKILGTISENFLSLKFINSRRFLNLLSDLERYEKFHPDSFKYT